MVPAWTCAVWGTLAYVVTHVFRFGGCGFMTAKSASTVVLLLKAALADGALQ